MKLRAFEIGSEEFWDYFFSLPKEQKTEIVNELNMYLDDSQANVYIEKELLKKQINGK